jgi:hypothetical protein
MRILLAESYLFPHSKMISSNSSPLNLTASSLTLPTCSSLHTYRTQGLSGWVSRNGRKVMHSSSTVASDTSSCLGKQKQSLLSLRTIRGSFSDELFGEIRHLCWQMRGAPPTSYLPTSCEGTTFLPLSVPIRAPHTRESYWHLSN